MIDRRWRLAASVAIACLFATAQAHADTRPRTRNLVLAGMGMGVPTYALGVAMHEGSHALMAKVIGARVTDYSLIPGLHPRTKAFYFGYVSVRGLKTNKQRALFLVAPKLTDSLMLGGFAALYATDVLPSDAYANTAVLVLATGFWVDFSKDILSFSDRNDTIKIYNMLGLDSELKRLPARLVHLALSVTMGASIYYGYRDLFARDVKGASTASAIVLPIWGTGWE